MDETRIIVTHGGQWIGYKYKGGESEIAFVSTNAMLDDLKKNVENIVRVDITNSTFDLHILVETSGRPAIPKLTTDKAVSFWLYEKNPEV